MGQTAFQGAVSLVTSNRTLRLSLLVPLLAGARLFVTVPSTGASLMSGDGRSLILGPHDRKFVQ
jgi:hypothetical protein